MEPFDIVTTPDGKIYTVHTMKTLDVREWVTFITLHGRGGHNKTSVRVYPSMDDAILGHTEICAILCNLHEMPIEEVLPEALRLEVVRRLIEGATRERPIDAAIRKKLIENATRK